ncbi:MAG TPA: helix-turn-helix domain-containing protein [Vicinamibacterales bacterium]|nr:helix-turn-helix domain-containing protein [Vicinamibacterales bacterium]
MKPGAPRSFGVQLRALRDVAGYTQEELATVAGLSVHAVSALERGERRRPHVDTVRALSAALDLTGAVRDAFVASARASVEDAAVEELSGVPLPLPPTALLGRATDLETLLHWLAEPAVRLITLTGSGGVGKTRLALELAHAVAGEAAIRVAFVSLAATRDPMFVATAIAEALGLSYVTPLDLPKRARVACADRPTLLVLDNFEQVLTAVPLVVDVLTAVASLRLLVTSRAPLRVRGEREYVVRPLALAVDSEAMSPPDLARSPAVRLFVERVREGQPHFRLTPANAAAVTAICRRLDALPLALELAAPWMKVLTPEDLLDRLGRGVLLSTAAPRDLPERQQTMNATVAWSYRLLGPNEQRAFRRLGALPGRFSMETAAAVLTGGERASPKADDALGPIAELMDKSLLSPADTHVATRPMYQMLETVRAYAALELTAAGERDDALDGLARYCTCEASQAAEGLVGPAQVEWLNRIYNELENYRSALAWLIQRGRATAAADMAWGLVFFWQIRGLTSEGLSWYEQIARLPSVPPGTESRMLVGVAAMLCAHGQFLPARDTLARAVALADTAQDEETHAHATSMLGRADTALGQLTTARTWWSDAVGRFEALAIPWGTGYSLLGLASVALAGGDTNQAERLLDEADEALTHAGPWFLTRTLIMRAVIADLRGHAEKAITMVRESLIHIRVLQDKFAYLYALVALAIAAELTGADAWAARIFGARDALAARTGHTVALTLVRDLGTEVERKVRARLDPEQWAAAYATGRVTSIDGLLKEIDHVLHSLQPLRSSRL